MHDRGRAYVDAPAAAITGNGRYVAFVSYAPLVVGSTMFLTVRSFLSVRAVRLVSVVMERTLTLLNCDDLGKGERRQFRLDRILKAEAV